jgi:uncharacterized membrane protein
MRFDDEIVIDVPAAEVWAIYSDVEHWPDWTASVSRVELVAGDRVAVGARARIEQPKLPKAEWEVSEVVPERSWTWVATAPGVRSTAIHTVEPSGPATTRVHQTLIQNGPLGAIVGRLYGRLTRRYLAMEAQGLKQRCEAAIR